MKSMKKIYSYISLVALAAVSAGCAEELVNPEEQLTNSNKQEQVINGELTVQLSVPASAQTKTVLGAKDGSTYPVYWSPEDVITLNGTAATEFTPSDDNTSATAKFKLTSLTAPYNFLYGGVSGKGDQVSYPATQNYVADGFDPAAMPMYASVTDLKGNVAFSHVGSLLRFSFTGENKISSITLTPADKDKSLSGNFTIGTSNGVLDGTLTPVSGSSSLLYSFGEDKQLSETPFVFYVAVPSGTYPGGISLEVYDNEAGHMTVKVMQENETIAAGKVREFENVVYEPQKEANLIQINSDATLQQFATRVKEGEYYLNARVSADFTATSAWTPVEDYKGIFDGNAKTISGLTQPLFNNLGGVIRNLTLNSNINATDADERSWGMFAKTLVPSSEVDDVAGLYNCAAHGSLTYTPSAALSGNIFIGGHVGINEGGVIENCTNEAVVTMGDCEEIHDGQISVGGVVGLSTQGGDLKTYGTITNCINNGTVTCLAKFSKNAFIGGVLGYQVDKKEYIGGCANNGMVTVAGSFSTTADLHLGGVIGMGKGVIESCTNGSNGTVASEKGSTVGGIICQGGVVGRLNRDTDDTYSGLTNAGNINVGAAGASTGAYVGGMVGRCDEGASLSDCTNTGGKIDFMGATSTCPIHIGGIVGQSKGRVVSCTNATAILFHTDYRLNTTGKYLSIGGVVGRQDADVEISNNTNTAAVTFNGYVTGYMALGGIVGYCSGPISGGENRGTVSYTGKSTAQNVPIGGIAGRTPGSKTGDRITGVTNRGEIIINSATQETIEFYVGGVVGHHQSGNVSAVNSGKVDVVKLTCDELYLGGVVGNQISGTVTGTNNGDVTISENCTPKENLLAGGIVGNSLAPVANSTNTGVISNAGTVTKKGRYIDLGGIVGFSNGNATLTNCRNSGKVMNTGNSAGFVLVGGISGENEAEIADGVNTGSVSNSGCSANGNPTAIGGIVGYMGAGSVTGTNSGSVTITEDCTASEHLFVGGVVGNAKVPITNCINRGVISNAGTIDAAGKYIDLGGVVGYNEGNAPLTDCSNSGDVINTGNSAGCICVGGISGENEADITRGENTGNVSNSGSAANGKPTAIGGVAGLTYGGNLTSCSSSIGEIKNTSACTSIFVGGIAGYIDASTNVVYDKCTNSSPVTVENEFESSLYEHVITGGIVGRSLAPITYSECQNDGEITINMDGAENKGGVRVGGIFGDNSKKDDPTDEESSVLAYDNYCTKCVNNAKVKLNLNYEDIAVEHKAYYAAGIAGLMDQSSEDGHNGGVISECTNNGSIEINANRGCVAGIIATMRDGEVVDCDNTGNIDFCYIKELKVFSAIGGIVANAWTDAREIDGCTNSGKVHLITKTGDLKPAGSVSGGIIGWAENDIVITDCENTGNVICENHTNTKYTGGMAGGIIGYKDSNSTDSGNINRGSVTSLARKDRYGVAGGVVGALHYGTIEACYNYGAIEAGETNSAGDETNSYWSKGRAGSIVGFYGEASSSKSHYYQTCEGTITKCYVGGTVKGKYTSGDLITVTADNYGGYIVGEGPDPTDCFFAGN